MKQKQQFEMVRLSRNMFGIRVRVKRAWFFWSSWGWVILGIGKNIRDIYVGDSQEVVQKVYDNCLENGVVPSRDPEEYWPVAEALICLKETENA